jgi:MFS family permease
MATSAGAQQQEDRAAGLGVLLAAWVSAFVVNANTSAVTILLPSISEDVHASVAKLQWAVTGYSLMGAAVIVTSGSLGDVFGRRKVFLGGLALFVGSCVLIALSTKGAGVVGGRVIQGAAGATILACGMSLLSVSASGVALVVLLRRHRPREPEAIDLAAAAASPLHTIPVPQASP